MTDPRRSLSYKKTAYSNAKPSWQKNQNRKFNEQSDKRDKYYDQLKFNLHPRDYIRVYKLYSKYCKLTKCSIDKHKTRIYQNSIKTMRTIKKVNKK